MQRLLALIAFLFLAASANAQITFGTGSQSVSTSFTNSFTLSATASANSLCWLWAVGVGAPANFNTPSGGCTGWKAITNHVNSSPPITEMLWCGYTTAGISSQTVTLTLGSSDHVGMIFQSATGTAASSSDCSTGMGVNNAADNAGGFSTALTVTVTGGASTSKYIGGGVTTSTSGTWTAGTNFSKDSTGYVNSNGEAVAGESSTTTLTSPVTVAMTGPSSTHWVMIGVEILAAGGAPSGHCGACDLS